MLMLQGRAVSLKCNWIANILLDLCSFDHSLKLRSGRAGDSGSIGVGFDPHWRHYVVSLSINILKTH